MSVSSKMTRAGIYWDLKKSHYCINLTYYKMPVRFYFSSLTHLNKFSDRYLEMREYTETWMRKRFFVAMNYDLLSDIRLYSQVETRGFYLEINGEGMECPEEIYLTFDGLNATRRELVS